MPVRLALLVVGSIVVAVTIGVVESGPGYSLAVGQIGFVTLLVGGIAPALVSIWLWPRRPKVCLLLFGVGMAWFLGEWDNPAAEPWVFTVGLIGYAVCPALVAQLAVTYDGRSTRWSSAIVASGYIITLIVMGVIPALMFAPSPSNCPIC